MISVPPPPGHLIMSADIWFVTTDTEIWSTATQDADKHCAMPAPLNKELPNVKCGNRAKVTVFRRYKLKPSISFPFLEVQCLKNWLFWNLERNLILLNLVATPTIIALQLLILLIPKLSLDSKKKFFFLRKDWIIHI